MELWGARIARAPWTRGEVRTHLQRRGRMDGARLLRWLEAEGFQACAIYRHFDLNRAALKATFVTLGGGRNAQRLLANIICWTYFEYYDKNGGLLLFKCPLCPQASSLVHRFQLAEIGPPPYGNEDRQQIIQYLSRMAKVLAPISPVTPLPLGIAGEDTE